MPLFNAIPLVPGFAEIVIDLSKEPLIDPAEDTEKALPSTPSSNEKLEDGLDIGLKLDTTVPSEYLSNTP